MQQQQRNKGTLEMDFFIDYGDVNRYKILEVIGKGSYGVVCSAIDTHTGEKVAIKKIRGVFEHVSDAVRILREIKLLRLLRHPDIVRIKHILLPPSGRAFKDIYVVFELMESDLHQVIKANDDLTGKHYQFFLYQLLRAVKYIHSANVYHRDLKPKNILANANCKLKICDFGLARVAFSDTPTTIFWTDYVATRWYRAPELCGSFYSKYTPAVDMWSIGCIFAELLGGKPLFPGKNVVHQLDLMTDLLGTPSMETISRVWNDKARKYLTSMRKKEPLPLSQKFPNADPLALKLLERLLAFEPNNRPTAEEALADPFFNGLAKVGREPCCQPISKAEFEFERQRLTKEDIRELIFCEILEYHPHLRKDYINGTGGKQFGYPSASDQFRTQFAHLEESGGRSGPVLPLERKNVSLPRCTVVQTAPVPLKEQPSLVRYGAMQVCYKARKNCHDTKPLPVNLVTALELPHTTQIANPGIVLGPAIPFEAGIIKDTCDVRRLMANAVIPQEPATLPTYDYWRNTGIETLRNVSAEAGRELIQHKPSYQCMTANTVLGIPVDAGSHPFYVSGGAKSGPSEDRMATDSNLQQGRSLYNGIAAASTAPGLYHRKGTANFGMSGMYQVLTSREIGYRL